MDHILFVIYFGLHAHSRWQYRFKGHAEGDKCVNGVSYRCVYIVWSISQHVINKHGRFDHGLRQGIFQEMPKNQKAGFSFIFLFVFFGIAFIFKKILILMIKIVKRYMWQQNQPHISYIILYVKIIELLGCTWATLMPTSAHIGC